MAATPTTTGPAAPDKESLLGVTAGALLNPGVPLRQEVRVMEASGVESLRVPFYWSLAQPFPEGDRIPRDQRGPFKTIEGRPTSFALTDPIVAAASRAGIVLLPVVVGTPPWAAKNPGRTGSAPEGTNAYADFMRALIGRYGPDGSFWSENRDVPKRPLRDWQLWNEPDHRFYWAEQPYARDYVRLAKAARRAIKEADPDASVIMSGFADRSWESIETVYNAGAKGVFDAAAIHPYTLEVQNVLRIVRLARQALREAGDAEQPLWLTEVTWSSGLRPGRKPGLFETTPRGQAARLSEALPLLIRTRDELGVERIYWENWISTDRNRANPFNFSGLRALRPDGTVRPKPAFEAYKRVALEQQARAD